MFLSNFEMIYTKRYNVSEREMEPNIHFVKCARKRVFSDLYFSAFAPKFYGQYILSEWNALPKGPFSNFASNIKRVN